MTIAARLLLRIDADLCGTLSIGTVRVVRLLQQHLALSVEQAVELVDRSAFGGETLEIRAPSAAAARRLAEDLRALTGPARVVVTVAGR